MSVSPLPLSTTIPFARPHIDASDVEAVTRVLTSGWITTGEECLNLEAELAAFTGAREVVSVERVGDLAITASETLRKLPINNVKVRFGDGMKGWEEEAPYDAIAVAAGGDRVPSALFEQLAIGGRMVIPIGAAQDSQKLIRIRKIAADRYVEDDFGGVRFVPLLPETD